MRKVSWSFIHLLYTYTMYIYVNETYRYTQQKKISTKDECETLTALSLFQYRKNQNEIEFWKEEKRTTKLNCETMLKKPLLFKWSPTNEKRSKTNRFLRTYVWSSFMIVVFDGCCCCCCYLCCCWCFFFILLYQHYLLVNINIVLFLSFFRPFAATFT